MESYRWLVMDVLENGVYKQNRTGIRALTVAHRMFTHQLQDGFPLLTTKKVPLKLVAVELEGFLKGITSKAWFQERGCHIWDEWCNPQKVPYSTDPETQERMKREPDLGAIYGAQWRDFNGEGYDQVKKIEETLATNPTDRRMVCSAWNPPQLNEMALPPCHLMWHVTVIRDTLHLSWFQRSCDVMLGIPFNIASYALLLLLLAETHGFQPGTLTGFLSDVHIYNPHIHKAQQQIQRDPYPLPRVTLPPLRSITEWKASQYTLENYQHHPPIRFPIAV